MDRRGLKSKVLVSWIASGVAGAAAAPAGRTGAPGHTRAGPGNPRPRGDPARQPGPGTAGYRVRVRPVTGLRSPFTYMTSTGRLPVTSGFNFCSPGVHNNGRGAGRSCPPRFGRGRARARCRLVWKRRSLRREAVRARALSSRPRSPWLLSSAWPHAAAVRTHRHRLPPAARQRRRRPPPRRRRCRRPAVR